VAVEPTVPIVRVGAQQTYDLRQRVLRPHQSVAEVAFPGDDDPGTGHFAALDPGGAVIGVVRVQRQAPTAPIAADPDSSWRLRGMATAVEHRQQGVGSALVAAVAAYVAAQGATLLWCHARLSAVAFYRRLGFVTYGETWEEPDIGPHVVMWRSVRPPS
jgi:ribosomal protein S18 acetylase RimI-like enzyme